MLCFRIPSCVLLAESVLDLLEAALIAVVHPSIFSVSVLRKVNHREGRDVSDIAGELRNRDCLPAHCNAGTSFITLASCHL